MKLTWSMDGWAVQGWTLIDLISALSIIHRDFLGRPAWLPAARTFDILPETSLSLHCQCWKCQMANTPPELLSTNKCRFSWINTLVFHSLDGTMLECRYLLQISGAPPWEWAPVKHSDKLASYSISLLTPSTSFMGITSIISHFH